MKCSNETESFMVEPKPLSCASLFYLIKQKLYSAILALHEGSLPTQVFFLEEISGTPLLPGGVSGRRWCLNLKHYQSSTFISMSVSGHCFQWSSSFMGLQPATERSNIAVDVAWGTCRIWFTLRRASRHWKGRIDRLDVGMWENMQGFRKGRKYLKLSLNNYTGLQVPDWNWFLNFNIECVSTSRFFPLYRLIYSRWTASDVYDVSKLAQGLRSIGLVFASLAGYLEVNETVRPKIIKAFQSKSDADVGRSSMRYSFLLGNAHFCLVPKGPLVADNLKTESSWRIFLKNRVGWNHGETEVVDGGRYDFLKPFMLDVYQSYWVPEFKMVQRWKEWEKSEKGFNENRWIAVEDIQIILDSLLIP